MGPMAWRGHMPVTPGLPRAPLQTMPPSPLLSAPKPQLLVCSTPQQPLAMAPPPPRRPAPTPSGKLLGIPPNPPSLRFLPPAALQPSMRCGECSSRRRSTATSSYSKSWRGSWTRGGDASGRRWRRSRWIQTTRRRRGSGYCTSPPATGR